MKTVLEIIVEQKVFTDAQRSLAWCPLPKREPGYASDCRPGGSCGVSFNHETLRDRVIQARFRFLAEQKRRERTAA